MTIRIEITGEDPAQIAQNIVSMAFLFAPHLRAVNAPAQTPVVEAVEAETVVPQPKPRGRAKKADVVIDHQAEEVKQDVHGVGGAGAGEGGDAAGGSAAGDASADAAAGQEEPAADDTPAEVDAVAEPCMTIDQLRAYTIEQYLNTCFETQPERRDAFKALLTPFGLEKIGDLPAEKVNEFKAVVDAKIGAKVKDKAA